MKGMLRDRFLSSDYEQHLYNLYLNCSQGSRSVHDYTTEFMRLAERNSLRETENQYLARYLSELSNNIRDQMGLQPVYDIHQVKSMALREEEFEKYCSANNFRRVVTYTQPQTNKGKIVAQNHVSTAPHAKQNQARGGTSGSNSIAPQQT